MNPRLYATRERSRPRLPSTRLAIACMLLLGLEALPADTWKVYSPEATVDAAGVPVRPFEVLTETGNTSNLLTLVEDLTNARDGVSIAAFAADRLSADRVFFALDASAPGGQRPRDVLRCLSDASDCTTVFSGASMDIPDGVAISAVGAEIDAGEQKLLLSFDTTFEAGGTVYRPADVARLDGGALSMALSHQDTGARSFWNVTGLARRPDGTWHLAFGNGGAIGSLQFFASDVLEADADGTITGYHTRQRDESTTWQSAGIDAWDTLASGAARISSNGGTINPGQSEVTLVVERLGQGEGEVVVDYTTVDGTAVAGQNYQTTAGTLVWSHGDTGQRQIRVNLLDAGGDAEKLDFRVELSPGSLWATTGNPSSATLVLPDEDVLFWDGFEN